MGFTRLLTSQVISVAFYSERENSDKFCSEVLISVWGSFTCNKPTTRDPQLYFPSEESHTRDFYDLKNPSIPAGFETKNLGSSGEYDNGTTGVDRKIHRRMSAVYSEHMFAGTGMTRYCSTSSLYLRSLPMRFSHFWRDTRGHSFASDEDVCDWVKNWFSDSPQAFSRNGIDRLVSQRDKCINSDGDYFWCDKCSIIRFGI